MNSSLPGFESFSDEKLAELSQNGNTDAMEYLLEKYRSVVLRRARTYFLVGAGKEDIVQEGMIGLFKAIRDYKPDKLAGFHAFAEMCIQRQIITAIKAATRQKHTPLNTYVSLNRPIFENEYETTLLDVIGEDDSSKNPEDIVLKREQLADISLKMDEILSSFESRVMAYYIQGISYQDIGERLGKSSKAIDNALQRIKRKIEKYLSEFN